MHPGISWASVVSLGLSASQHSNSDMENWAGTLTERPVTRSIYYHSRFNSTIMFGREHYNLVMRLIVMDLRLKG